MVAAAGSGAMGGERLLPMALRCYERRAAHKHRFPMRTIGHFINGKAVEGTSGRFGDIYNPSTGEVQARVALASKAEMRQAVEVAKKAFVEWRAVNPQRRARVMFNFKALVEKHM